MKKYIRKVLIALSLGVALSGGFVMGSTITNIAATDTISSSRSVINTNFTNLNTDKLENNTTFTVTTSTNVVGVGTSTPAYTLDVYGNVRLGTSSASVILLRAGTTTIMNGNVGIGTTTPAYTLDVYGNARLGTSTASSLFFRGISNFNSNFYIDTSGNIATGTWQGTAIADAYIPDTITITNNATTGTALSVFAGQLNISTQSNLVAGRSLATSTAGQIDADAELYTKTLNFNMFNATSTGNKKDGMYFTVNALTIVEIGCFTDSGTSSAAFSERLGASPNASNTTILSHIVCDTDSASTTSFTDSAIAAGRWIGVSMTDTLNSTNTYIYIKETVDD